MRFRDAVEDDLPSIVGLLADDALGAGREDVSVPLPPGYRRALDEIQRSGANRIIVAVDAHGEIVGCLQLTIVPGLSRKGMRRALIEAVRIDKRLRGKGMGTQLVAFAIGEAKSAGCGLVQLTTDSSRKDAHRFYERLGFVASHVGMKMVL